MFKVEHVPTNIITGALGVGKTTLIQTLLEQKPEHERWAVLVNEFGEIGIDGALLSNNEGNSVFIREVPGGCMCCSSGLPMQIALNMLLAKAKPHRLLIEPTGLGHPKEVLQTLTAEHYRDILDVNATLTLVDIRKLVDKRWREHPTFQEQLHIADHIIATKSDLYDGDLADILEDYLDELGVDNTPITYSNEGQIDIELLESESTFSRPPSEHHHAHLSNAQSTVDAPPVGSIKIENSGEGYFSCGWVCAPSKTFNYKHVVETLASLGVERLKAVMRTEQGEFGFNLSDGELIETRLEQAIDSRIEFLTQDQTLAKQTINKLESVFDLTDFTG